ncbi:hypothetical protein H0I54_14840 [Yersinia kristensenii]|uniref:hypothetical protein n=1 Tax=Yersinia kristensenii TaxID=28152 RepID=UPI001C60DED7|nr:hypothetical protein [Yersinia kristensenii]MBW5843085.1 hypothetical protein [Yersinia kristensenii]
MFKNFNLPPYSHEVKYYSHNIILRSLISVLTPEQRKGFDEHLALTLQYLENDSNIDPELLNQIKGAVMFKS